MAGRLESTVSGLRELDDMKSAFVSTVSHELRTPLTSILGYTDALLDGEAGPLNEEQEEYAQAVQRNARRLHSLVDDLLTVSRLDAGRIHLEHRRVALGPIVEATCADLRSRADGKGVAVSVDVRDAAVVDGDAVRLGQIVTNLMSNAVKFTPGGGSVRVGVQRDDGHVDLVVADQGIGIPADELPRLFERFFRASTAGHVEGTGLGLSITRELVELHGGTLSVTSTEGEGSTFRVIRQSS
jgi:signal transduction histidine kinase